MVNTEYGKHGSEISNVHVIVCIPPIHRSRDACTLSMISYMHGRRLCLSHRRSMFELGGGVASALCGMTKPLIGMRVAYRAPGLNGPLRSNAS